MEWLSARRLRSAIEGLDDARFADLCNTLLSETAAYCNIPRSCLSLTLNVTANDGGIDARCSKAPVTVQGLIPRPDVIYQFRSGKTKKSAKKLVKDDIMTKPAVLAAIQNGEAFVYLAGWDPKSNFECDIRSELSGRGISTATDQVLFRGATSTAHLLRPLPAVAASLIGAPAGMFTLPRWSATRTMRNPFKTDEDVEARLSDLRRVLSEPNARVRLLGAAGDGKTRTALEALRSCDLKDSVLYAPQVGDAQPQWLSTYLHDTNDARCTLVVDEVDDANYERLTNYFSDTPPGVRVLMIGTDASGRSRPDTLQVEGLSQGVLVETIRAIAIGLSKDQAITIANDCERSPKLAVLIANRIQADPGLAAPGNLLSDGEMRSALDRYLDISPGDPDWSALSVVALMTRVGWAGAVDGESEHLFRAAGLDPIDARRRVEDFHERYGVAPIAGRYRYVSPEILADHLAAKQLQPWPRSNLALFIGGLTGEMPNSFAKRLSRVYGALQNRDIIEEVLLGPLGPFRNLMDIEANGNARFLRLLCGTFPAASLRALERIVAGPTISDLRSATGCRHELVCALEDLLWAEETFEGAATLLLRLAVAENDRQWANNATAVWEDAFRMAWSRTTARTGARLRVIRRAAASASADERRLASAAIASALGVDRTPRLSRTPPYGTGPMRPEVWRPATNQEWADSLTALLDELAPLLRDPDPVVGRSAAAALAAGLTAAIKLGDALLDRWIGAARTLAETDYGIRSIVIAAIKDAEHRWSLERGDAAKCRGAETKDGPPGARVIDERLGELERVMRELVGSDFSSRLREAISNSRDRAIGLADQGKETRTAETLRDLAREAVADPRLLDSEWHWLIEDSRVLTAGPWIEILGDVDKQRVLQPSIVSLSLASQRGVRWLSLYEMSYVAHHGDAAYIEGRISQLAESGRWPQIFDLNLLYGYTSAGARLIATMLERGFLEPAAINALCYPPWGARIPPVDAAMLVSTAAPRCQNKEELVPFIHVYLQQVPSASTELRDVALELLLDSSAERTPAMTRDVWPVVACLYAAAAPAQLLQAALVRIRRRNIYLDDGYTLLLQAAWKAADKSALFEGVVAHWVLYDGDGVLSVRDALSHIPLAEAGTQTLLDWISVDPDRRAPRFAELIGAPWDPPSELHVALLQKFGPQVGSVFLGSFVTGHYLGRMSDGVRTKLAIARRLADNTTPAVKDWAHQLVRNLESDLTYYDAREKQEDAEDRFA